MTSRDQYITLISSLPPHVTSFFPVRQTPISRLTLEQRLKMLEPTDARDLHLIENLMHWDRMVPGISDAQVLNQAHTTLAQMHSGFIREIIRWRLELRTLIAALRRRAHGKAAPAIGNQWGFGRWVATMELNWGDPNFGLGQIFPWINDLVQMFADHDHLAIERMLLELTWNYYGRVVGDHYFDFEAVVVYVLRWDVIDRWSRYDADLAQQRFAVLLAEGLGEFADTNDC